MQNKIKQHFSRPYPLIFSEDLGYIHIIVLCIIIDLLIFIEEPFGIINFQQPDKWLKLSAYGPFYGLIYTYVHLLPAHITPKYYNKENWNYGKEIGIIILFFLLVGFVNWTYTYMIISQFPLSFASFLKAQLFTFTFGFIPVLLIISVVEVRFLNQIKLNKPAPGTSSVLSQNVPPGDKIIVIRNIIFIKNDLYSIESKGNDRIAHVCRNGKFIDKRFRCTFKELALDLNPHPQFQRCHCSYVVNTDNVEKWEGNSNGMSLHLKNGAVRVPVSSSYTEKIKNILTAKCIFNY